MACGKPGSVAKAQFGSSRLRLPTTRIPFLNLQEGSLYAFLAEGEVSTPHVNPEQCEVLSVP